MLVGSQQHSQSHTRRIGGIGRGGGGLELELDENNPLELLLELGEELLELDEELLDELPLELEEELLDELLLKDEKGTGVFVRSRVEKTPVPFSSPAG